MKFKLSLGTVTATVLVLWLFVLAVPDHLQVLVHGDSDEDPWLAFTDMVEFETYMNSIKDMSDDELDMHLDSLNFYSIRRAMDDDGNPQVGNDVVYEDQDNFVEDDYLASVLNPGGILQIGFDVIVVCQDIVYRFPEDQTAVIDDLDLFAEAIPPDLPPGVDAYLIERIESTIMEEQAEGAFILATKKAKCTNQYMSKHRLKGRAWMTSWCFYASVGAKTYNQKQKKFLWWKWWKGKRVE